MEENKIQHSKPVPPFVRFCAANIPMVFDDSLSYYEALCALWKWLQTDVIDVINNNARVTEVWREELTTFENNVTDEIEGFETVMRKDFADLVDLFNQLQAWVDNYFDNLDVQEEINNKLDDMAEQGVLADIISQYLNSVAIFGYDNVASMKASKNLIDGSYARTLGYYAKDDRGGALYRIRTITNEDVVDGGSIIAMEDDTLVAELIIEGSDVYVKQFGAKGDGVTDDTQAIENAVAFVKYGQTLHFNSNEVYKVTKTIYLPCGANYIGHKCSLKVSDLNDDSYVLYYGQTDLTPAESVGFITYELKGFSIIGNNVNTNHGIYVNADVNIDDIYTWSLDRSIRVSNNYIDFVKISNVNVRGKLGTNYAIDSGYLGDGRVFNNIHFHKQSLQEDASPNMLQIGGGHNSCIIDGYLNGNLNITGSNVIIRNAHIEMGTITADSCELTFEGGYIYKTVGAVPVTITNSLANLSNILISYRTDNNYSSDSAVDLSIDDKSFVNVKNFFSVMQGSIIGFKHYAGVNTNINNFNVNSYNNSVNSSINHHIVNTYYQVESPNFTGNILGLMYTDSNVSWKEESGTYYYSAMCIFDKTRLVAFRSGANELNATLTNGSKCAFLALNGRLNSDIRIYRGTTTGSYDKVVDTSTFTARIIDDGFICNGHHWENREAGGRDSVNDATAYEKINKENVRVYSNAIPTVGTWKKGDIIVKNNPIAGSPYGWVCTEAGTPGTWKPMTQNIPS